MVIVSESAAVTACSRFVCRAACSAASRAARSARYRRALSIASAMRRAIERATARSASRKRRSDSAVVMKVMTPSVRARATMGTCMSDRTPTARQAAAISGAATAREAKYSSGTSAVSSGCPVRIARPTAPFGECGSACVVTSAWAQAARAGSACATVTVSAAPSPAAR